MGRRTEAAAQAAAQAASEAARVLAARSQEVKQAKVETPVEESVEKPEAVNSEKLNELRKNVPHRRMMEEMERLDMERKGIKEEKPEEKTEEPKPEVKAEEPKPETKEEEKPEPEAPKTVHVKVDGEEFDAPAEEVEAAGGVKAFQILKASENRLKKAQEVLAEAQKHKVDIGQLAQALRPKEPEKPKETDAEFIAARMDIIRFGTQQEAANAQLEIMQRMQPRALDPNAITAQAVDRINHDLAVKDFEKEFQDLTANPLLIKLVDTIRQEKIKTMQWPVNWSDFYRRIGNEVRSAVGRPSQPATTSATTASTPSQPSEKEARKASIVTLPTAAARAEGPKEEKQPTPEEARLQALADMRKARGQAG